MSNLIQTQTLHAIYSEARLRETVIAPLEIPNAITDNIKSDLRQYQIDGLKNFIYYLEHDKYKQKENHLLFNMATGSGKTLMMASLILYLYQQGYRNFLFFVNSSTIISKTKENFLGNSAKALFKSNIIIDDKAVSIKQVDNFEDADENAINLCITTIQSLHSFINTEKENQITIDDFLKQKTVLLADEAHHLNSKTKTTNKTSIDKNWEDTILKIFNSHADSMLLEFTATMNWNDASITTKYYEKLIYQYDIRKFRSDGFSKEIEILQSNVENEELMLGACILSEYRYSLASDLNLFIKPVILFKAQRTIDESRNNQAKFLSMINNLTEQKIVSFKNNLNNDTFLNTALDYFEAKDKTFNTLLTQLQTNFKEENTLNTNEKELTKSASKTEIKEEQNQEFLLNTLEEKNNPIRAIFSVNKLNEGWDVLNLFDIVRLYNTRDTNNGKAGTTTVSEAQLIGRGARYYPFKTNDDEDMFTRKYTQTDDNKKILETIFYHSINNSEYISELKKEMENQGWIENYKEEEFKIADNKKDLVDKLLIFQNERVKKEVKAGDEFMPIFDNGTAILTKTTMQKIVDKIKEIKFEYNCVTGQRREVILLKEENNDSNFLEEIAEEGSFQNDYDGKSTSITLSNIPTCIKKSAWYTTYQYGFNHFNKSYTEFKSFEDFLKQLEENLDSLGDIFKFKGLSDNNKNQSYYQFLIKKFYPLILKFLKEEYSEYYGSTTFTLKSASKFFAKPKTKKYINLTDITTEKIEKIRDSYAQNIFPTDSNLEKDIIDVIEEIIADLNKEGHTDILFIRNDLQYCIYDFDKGTAFYPDFLLASKNKEKNCIYQVIIEAKGEHLVNQDKWKEELLKELGNVKVASNYKLVGLDFYTGTNHATFKSIALKNILP